MTLNLETIWESALTLIRNEYSNNDSLTFFDAYFSNTQLVELNDISAIIAVEDNFHKLVLSQIDTLTLIDSSISAVTHSTIQTTIVLKEEYIPDFSKKIKEDVSNTIEPQYSFDNFVMGNSNRAAYQAAVACAALPGQQIYNPLFIYGISGVGKTHLLHSIGNYIKVHSPAKRVLFISSHDLVNKVHESIVNKTIDDYKEFLNSVDILLVDDIQFLSGKGKTNEIFFGVYNELYNNHKQIVLTSDRLPNEIEDLERRLVSRFSQGLSVCITQPEYETSVEIVKMKLKEANLLSIVDEKVISFIATNFSNDVRTVQGAINQLIFYAINLFKSDYIDMELVNNIFKEKISSNNQHELEVKDIIKIVIDYYGLTKYQLLSKTRTKNIADARHIAMYLCKKHLDISYDKIGDEFGHRDHSTVLNAYLKIDQLVKKNENYKKAIFELEQKIFN